MSRRGGAVAVALVAAAALAGGGACKATLTPGGLYDLAKGIKDAKKELTPENEYYLGRAVGTKILANADYRYEDEDGWQSGRLSSTTAYVNAVGNVVAFAAMGAPRDGDRPSPLAGWHFVILDDESINAFAAPGGYVFVTSGAIHQARSEDELAAILAHEVAHVVRGHAIGSIQKSRMSGVMKQFLDSSVELDPEVEAQMASVFGGSIDDIVDGALVKGYSKDTEFEADRVGLAIMVAAGYDPQAFVSYLRTLASHQDTGSGGFYATHPKASERIAKLEALVAKQAPVRVPAIRVERFEAAVSELP
ncbi:MAG: M48 family metalloprotease [Kofleriaceae bacterium]|nr:M48 family metalloprotease [Myxococcales bacterium]MCB9564715.1 M48 family metalloprotease [Kofleriaceae bacterium]MCB9573950.1 M48 family metalloprotease [Kofleriaceae bacterium]